MSICEFVVFLNKYNSNRFLIFFLLNFNKINKNLFLLLLLLFIKLNIAYFSEYRKRNCRKIGRKKITSQFLAQLVSSLLAMAADYAIKLVTRRSTTRKKNYIEQQTTIIIKQHLYISLVLCKFQLFFAQRPTALHNSRNNMIGDLLKSKSRLLFSFCRQQPFFFCFIFNQHLFSYL